MHAYTLVTLCPNIANAIIPAFPEGGLKHHQHQQVPTVVTPTLRTQSVAVGVSD
jgi:hypothetical protein